MRVFGTSGPFGGPWDRRLWRLAGPIILSNLSVPLLGAVDTAVVGHLPDPANLGAVAVGATIFSFVYWGFGFLKMSTTGLTGQAYGSEQAYGSGAGRGPTSPEVAASFYRAAGAALVIAALILLLQGPIGAVAFALIDPGAEVARLGETYFAVRVWAAPAVLLNYALLGWFLGVQDARTPLLLQLAINGLNILLDLLFVMGFGWGVAGVAAATALAETVGLALGLWLLRRRLAALALPGPFALGRAALLEAGRLRRLVAVNRDIFIRTLCLIGAFAYFTAQGARMGEVTLAANAVLLNFLTIASFGLDGFAHAAEAMIGGAVGRNARTAFDGAARAAFRWAAGLAVLLTALFVAGGEVIVALLTDIPEVRAEAARYILWPGLLPLVSVWCFTLDGIFIGATRSADLRNGMLVSLLAYLAVLHLAAPSLENHGLWLAMTVFMGVRGLALAVRYPRLRASLAPSGGMAGATAAAAGAAPPPPPDGPTRGTDRSG